MRRSIRGKEERREKGVRVLEGMEDARGNEGGFKSTTGKEVKATEGERGSEGTSRCDGKEGNVKELMDTEYFSERHKSNSSVPFHIASFNPYFVSHCFVQLSGNLHHTLDVLVSVDFVLSFRFQGISSSILVGKV